MSLKLQSFLLEKKSPIFKILIICPRQQNGDQIEAFTQVTCFSVFFILRKKNTLVISHLSHFLKIIIMLLWNFRRGVQHVDAELCVVAHAGKQFPKVACVSYCYFSTDNVVSMDTCVVSMPTAGLEQCKRVSVCAQEGLATECSRDNANLSLPLPPVPICALPTVSLWKRSGEDSCSDSIQSPIDNRRVCGYCRLLGKWC